MKKRYMFAFWIIGVICPVFTLNVAGSSTVRPIIAEAGASYTEQSGIGITVSGGGSGYGTTSVIDGSIDIGMCSRNLKQAELDAGVEAIPIGYDGLAIIVNSENPIHDLSRDDVVAIYTGKIESWQELNWTDENIISTVKEEGRGARDLFDGFFDIEGRSKGDYELGSNPVSIAFVAGDPYAISYVSIGTAETAIADGVPIKILSINGIMANSETLRNGTYTLKRPLLLVTLGEAKGDVLSFFNFILSSRGQSFVKSQGFVSVN